jgi:hypothetical protein
VFYSGDSDVYFTVSLSSNNLVVVANDFDGVVVTSAAASDVLFMEPGIYSDNTFLTNKGFCPVGEWCTADADLTYRMNLLNTNTSYPAGNAHPTDDTTYFAIDAFTLVTANEEVDMTWYDERIFMPNDQIGSLEFNLWPTGIKWSNFQMKELYNDLQLAWEVSAGTDFSIYRTERCDDDDGMHGCHLDPLVSFDLSGIFSNPFVNPFSSFSFLFDEVEAPGEVDWDEQPTFSLFG